MTLQSSAVLDLAFDAVSETASAPSVYQDDLLPPSLLQALLGGLDTLSHGIALFDSAGRLRYANVVARTRLSSWARARGVMWEGRFDATCLRPLSDALRRVCWQDRREFLILPCGEGDRSVALLPVRADAEALVFAVFSRDEICGPIELQMYAKSIGMTHSETRVLSQLCKGLTAPAIALANGVSHHTVHTQISAVRSKTETVSIRSLVCDLARLPPLLPRGVLAGQASWQA